jgi:hypothetical protein
MLPLLLSTLIAAQPGPSLSRSSAPDDATHEPSAWSIGAEAAYNGLTGVGGLVSYDLSSRLALDAGVGASFAGPKAGIRARYSFPLTWLSPFVGVGFSMAAGTGADPVVMHQTFLPTVYKVTPSPYAQLVVGLANAWDNGLTLLVTAGWAQLLREKNLIWVAAPTIEYREQLPRFMGSDVIGGATLLYRL